MTDPRSNKSVAIIALFCLIFLIYAGRLFYLQIVDPDYRELAGDRINRRETLYPERGLIYDREGQLVVYNEPIYNLMVIPGQVGEMDTTRFCEILSIDLKTFRSQLSKAKRYSRRKASIFIKEISASDYAKISEFLHHFPGFYPEVRTVRRYPHESAAHVLGYVGEVDTSHIRKSGGYYRSGDYIGRTGIENRYEEELRGERGARYVLVDNFYTSVGKFRNGEWDSAASSGSNLHLSLDIALQQYGEKLMQNKKGSIVAIEPSTGEILALVSAPSYDPNLLVGRARSGNYRQLAGNESSPMNNRALSGYYPPGSIFKPLMAVMALQDEVIHNNFYYACNSGYYLGNLRVGCHAHTSCSNVASAIQHSCNAYFCAAYKRFIEQPGYSTTSDAFEHWRNYLVSFGLGERTGIDLAGEISGNVPTVADYDKDYGQGRWRASTTITLGIGQDKLIITPLQQANMMAAIANRGYWYRPHLVREVEGNDEKMAPYRERKETGFDRKHFEYVVEGLADVVEKGTGTLAKIPGIEVCGKTGTAENPHGEDHSVFVAFAPKDNPQIAIATLVENSGWGGSWAAPICGLMIEQYLNDSIHDSKLWLEKRILEANFIDLPEEEGEEEEQ
jgi:penicillin-binding protein 2